MTGIDPNSITNFLKIVGFASVGFIILALAVTLSVEPSGVETYFEIVAWISGILIVLAFATGIAILRYNGIDREQRRHLYAIRPQLFDASPVSIRVRSATGFSSVEARVRGLLSESKRDFRPPTVRDASRSLIAAIRAGLPDAPRLAVRGAVEGLIIVSVGLLLWSVPLVWAAIQDPETVPLLEVASVALGLLPGFHLISTAVLTVGVVAASLVTVLWLPIGLLLIAGAIALVEVDRRTKEDLSVTLFPDRDRLIAGLVLAPVLIWFAGAIPNAALSGLGAETAGVIVGAVSALLVTAGCLAYGIDALDRALFYRQSQRDENPRAVAAYLLVRKSFGVFAVLALPIVVWQVYRGLSAVGSIVVTRPVLSAGVTVGIVLSLVVLSRRLFRDETTALFAAIGRWLQSRALRAWVFSRGIPVSAMVLTFLIAWVFDLRMAVGPIPVLGDLAGLFPAVLAAIVIGALVRVGTLLWQRAKYQFVSFDDDDGQRTVLLDVYPPITDADGDSIYVISVGGLLHAHRDRDELLADVRTACNGLFEEGELPMTFSRYYWHDLEFGTVDINQVRRECRGDVRSRMLATVREHDRVDETVIDEELMQKYPESIVERERAQVLARGDLARQDGKYVHNV